ncbi:membrane cofactor protein-like [Rana temporaria]|uniref:membrane cofactor protein-like n=1 Tax=Rana temporaria TaxID=8407 RepID=UPI001AACE865|nr:membrane cofactor protein-like [Rana temporaria]
MFPQKNVVRDHWGFLLLCISAFIAASYGINCRHPGETENGDVHIDNTLFGSRVNYTCHTGYNMISRKSYRECQADGLWSNEVPVCEVQDCEPPYTITDGSFSPEKDEYVYQDSVTYRCNEIKFALIGQPSVFCTAYGNWSSDAPKCVAVECSSPDVANAAKTSGFSGPYYLNFAVTFECFAGFTMNGSNFVKCNASSQWDPPLPTCNKNNVAEVMENNVAEVMGNIIVILTMIFMGHVLSHRF